MRRIGTQQELSEDERGQLVAELAYWKERSARFFGEGRRMADGFNCRWKGQDISGLKLDSEDEAAWPFDQSSDQRIRWGDAIFQELEALFLIAVASARVEITCAGGADAERRAASIQKLLKWEISKMGAQWTSNLRALAYYMLVDTPAVAAMDVGWTRRTALGVARLERTALEEEYVAWRTAADEASVVDASTEFSLALEPSGSVVDEAPAMAARERFAKWLVDTRGCYAGDIEAIASALLQDGECEARARVAAWEGPEVKALRFGEDFCFPERVEDFSYASPWFRTDWVTEAWLRERIAEDGWDAGWVEESIRSKGQAFYADYSTEDLADLKDFVNIVWCYTLETSETGETARAVTVLSPASGSAFGKRLLTNRHGRWDVIVFRREVKGGNITGSRGIAEIAVPDAGVAKMLRDLAADNAILGSVPPVKAKGSRVRDIILEPLAEISMGASDDVSFMQPPAYPAAADRSEEKIKRELWSYFGVAMDGNTDVSERRRAFVIGLLPQVRDLYVALIEAAQDFASDEILATVTGDGDTRGLKREDIRGDFGLTLELDPSNLNDEVLSRKIGTIAQLMQSLDRKGEIDGGAVARYAFIQLFPELSRVAFKSPEALTMDDVADEQRNFVLIKAGIMPQMDTSGKWNYGARIGWYREQQQSNPGMFEDLSADSQQKLSQWLQALEMQERQYGENAEIGRTGVESIESKGGR
jgi:hypothetical protein